ncbi:PTS system beta-glucoside-specific EIIBCA component BglP [Clostridium sartagoforme AAU1]|uniref:PTS system beta-glucoside-specific EIIBCA component BglP n=1 Tax=Clostridium sartagoforme AAU1 TaxID=1202534 RepID=R9CBI0_9CLOT|nr:beta-glucoside-specific PTS transporter subunit IIABC [Clostridium sartagoforme]EOR26340.1 PTS system beta-glucoside-specific EIIBCA component BglP [Clostridium sartagoforme AAU1]
MNYKNLAIDLLKLVGGEKNVVSVTNCMTRLRFNLNDNNKAKVDEIKKLNGVQGVVNKNGQFQVIIGTDVSKVCDEIHKLGNFGENESSSEENETGIINKVLGTITAIFTPVIPALAGSGMIKAVLAILKAFGLVDVGTQTYTFLTFISDTVFYFLPVILAFSAAKRFKCSPYIAAVLGAALLHPSFSALNTGDPVHFFGIPITMISYASSVVPILLIIFAQSYIEKFAKKISPNSVKVFLVPLITILITSIIGFTILGPLGNIVGKGLAVGMNFVNDRAGWLIPVIMGTFTPFFVMTGMHYCFAPIQQIQYATLGYGTILGPGMLSSNIAQATSALIVALKTKNKSLKQLGLSSSMTAYMGITEPALYGVNFKLKKPLYASMIGGGIAGLYAGITGIRTYASATAGFAAIPVYISDDLSNVRNACITIVISIVATAIASLILGFKDIENEDSKIEKNNKEDNNLTSVVGELIVNSPVKGEVIPLSEVKDDVFSQELMGKGIAILPAEGKVYSPIEGTVESIFKTKHAIGLRSKDGVEVLIHVGLDTVQLNGKYFTSHVEQGNRVNAGDLLLEFDKEGIKNEGYDIITPVIITNTAEYMDVLPTEKTFIKEKETLIRILK